MQRPPRYSGLSSVEEKVALALADKEGIALKRQRAIQEEAEKKRLKKEATDRAKQKALAQVQGIIRNPVETAPVEEKYCGPLLDGSAPEMIVPSGALGMTETRRKQQINYQQSKRKRTIDAGFGISEAGPPKFYKPKSYQPIDHLNSHDSYYEGSMPSSSSSFPTISDFESEPGNIDPISQSILRCIENSLTETREESDFPIEYSNEKSIEVDNLIAQVHEFAAPIEEPAPELTEEEKRRIEDNEKAIARFREIGRRICEIELIDFSADKGKNDRKTFMIASRGEEILATVRRNLAVIRDKLGEYAKGTIFDYVDELSNSFADVTPNAITRLNMVVAEKMRQNTMQEVEKAATSSSESGEFKTEDFEVKLEPPEYTED